MKEKDKQELIDRLDTLSSELATGNPEALALVKSILVSSGIYDTDLNLKEPYSKCAT